MNPDSFLLATGTGKKGDILVWFVDTFLETFGTVAFGIADKVFKESFAGVQYWKKKYKKHIPGRKY